MLYESDGKEGVQGSMLMFKFGRVVGRHEVRKEARDEEVAVVRGDRVRQVMGGSLQHRDTILEM